METCFCVRLAILFIVAHRADVDRNDKKFELRLTRRAKAYSSSCSQTVSLSPRLLRGTALWCSRAQISLNLENRDLDSRNLRSMLKISYAACLCLSQLVSAQLALEKCLAAQNRQKTIKPLFKRSRSSKVIEIDGNREPVYDLLLVINSKLGAIWHLCWDTATC